MAYVNPSALQNIQPGGYYPVSNAQFGALQTGVQAYPNNNSDNPDDWDTEEKVKFFLWFMKMHHEEDIKGFKAMRDIERSVEREQQLERERLELQAYQQMMAIRHQMLHAQAAQNSYTYNATTPYGTIAVPTQPTKRPLWKRLLAM